MQHNDVTTPQDPVEVKNETTITVQDLVDAKDALFNTSTYLMKLNNNFYVKPFHMDSNAAENDWVTRKTIRITIDGSAPNKNEFKKLDIDNFGNHIDAMELDENQKGRIHTLYNLAKSNYQQGLTAFGAGLLALPIRNHLESLNQIDLCRIKLAGSGIDTEIDAEIDTERDAERDIEIDTEEVKASAPQTSTPDDKKIDYKPTFEIQTTGDSPQATYISNETLLLELRQNGRVYNIPLGHIQVHFEVIELDEKQQELKDLYEANFKSVKETLEENLEKQWPQIEITLRRKAELELQRSNFNKRLEEFSTNFLNNNSALQEEACNARLIKEQNAFREKEFESIYTKLLNEQRESETYLIEKQTKAPEALYRIKKITTSRLLSNILLRKEWPDINSSDYQDCIPTLAKGQTSFKEPFLHSKGPFLYLNETQKEKLGARCDAYLAHLKKSKPSQAPTKTDSRETHNLYNLLTEKIRIVNELRTHLDNDNPHKFSATLLNEKNRTTLMECRDSATISFIKGVALALSLGILALFGLTTSKGESFFKGMKKVADTKEPDKDKAESESVTKLKSK